MRAIELALGPKETPNLGRIALPDGNNGNAEKETTAISLECRVADIPLVSRGEGSFSSDVTRRVPTPSDAIV